MTQKMQFLFLTVLLGCVSACVTTSPPLTMQVGKMPEILHVKEKEIQLGYGWGGDDVLMSMAILVQPQISYGFKERWQLDVGTLIADAINDNGSAESVMGAVGMKYGFLKHKRWSGAVPFGLGMGCGGFNGDDDTSTTFKCSDGFAYGAYTGIDFGYRLGRVVGVYQGNRFEFSKASGLPFSVLGLHVLGFQFDIFKKLYVSFEVGEGWFLNQDNSDRLFKYSGNIGVHW